MFPGAEVILRPSVSWRKERLEIRDHNSSLWLKIRHQGVTPWGPTTRNQPTWELSLNKQVNCTLDVKYEAFKCSQFHLPAWLLTSPLHRYWKPILLSVCCLYVCLHTNIHHYSKLCLIILTASLLPTAKLVTWVPRNPYNANNKKLPPKRQTFTRSPLK